MRVAHLTTVHPPGDTRILVKECKSLASEGHDVTLVYAATSDYVPTKMDSSGVQMVRVEKPKGRIGRIVIGVFRLLRAALSLKADVYHFHDPELIPAGLILRLTGAQVVYDVHEDYSEAFLYKEWLPKSVRRLSAFAIGFLERTVCRFFSAIVVATPRIAENFRHPTIGVVRNYPKLDEFLSIDTSDYGDRRPYIVYIGVLSEERSVYEMVDAMPMVAAKVPGARLLLGGVYSAGTRQSTLEQRAGWEYVEFLGWQSRSELIDQLQRSRVGLIVFHPVGNYREALSVKMFEYMAAGLPSVVSDFPINREMAVDHGEFAEFAKPKSVESLAQSIVDLLENSERSVTLGKVGREMVESHYNWRNETRELLRIYESLADAKS